MTQTATQEPEVDAGEQVTRIEDLPDPVRREIVAQREAGTTLSELKANFPGVAPEVIREVLPPGNARERRAREAKQPKAGGKAPQAPQSEPEAPPEPRYAAGTDTLAERVLAAREVVGRNQLAALLDTTGSAVWRWERNRVHPDELAGLEANLAEVEAKIEAGDFVKPERPVPGTKQPSRAELEHRLAVLAELLTGARGDKTFTKVGLIDAALAVLGPRPAEKSETS